MRVLVDTNLLLRMAEPGHPQNPVAEQSVPSLVVQGRELFVVPQVLYEFWSVATRPISANGLGKTPAEADAEISGILKLFQLLDDVAKILQQWRILVSTLGVIGRNAHDARLVASMDVHGIGEILTFNGQDFRRYPSITVLDPFAVAASVP